MSDKEEKPEEVKAQEPLKDVTGKEISEEALKDIAGGTGTVRVEECTTNSNVLNFRQR